MLKSFVEVISNLKIDKKTRSLNILEDIFDYIIILSKILISSVCYNRRAIICLNTGVQCFVLLFFGSMKQLSNQIV